MAKGGKTMVVVVGGGCSGTLVTTQLLRQHPVRPLRVVMIEPKTVGRGIAYGTTCASHLLNSPAGTMSAYGEQPQHFVQWARRRRPDTLESSFLPRGLYGDYLRSVLADAMAAAPRSTSLSRTRGEVVAVNFRRGSQKALVGLADGGHIEADRVILAIGNLPPAHPRGADARLLRNPRYVADPWKPGGLSEVSGSVLLIGTGLTALDVALALEDQGHTGPVHAVSRRGLLPRAHLERTPVSGTDVRERLEPAAFEGHPSVRQVLTIVRSRARRTGDWRSAVDDLRLQTPRIWASFSEEERSRFLRHAHRYWEVHRHRMAPEVARRVAAMSSSGRLVVHTGAVERFEDRPEQIRAVLRRRPPPATDALDVSYVVNCTGPQSDVTAAGNRLLDNLLVSGRIRAGSMGLGIDVDPAGAVRDVHGGSDRVLWAIGPLCRGALWEATAVPEIRSQAARLAALVADHSDINAGGEIPPISAAVDLEGTTGAGRLGEVSRIVA